jgi:hypothetical protein
MSSGRGKYARAVIAPEILRSLPLADEILESHRQRAHGDEAGYPRWPFAPSTRRRMSAASISRSVPTQLLPTGPAELAAKVDGVRRIRR